MYFSSAAALAALSTSAATVDLRSTDSGAAVKRPEDSSAAAVQSGPSTTPAVSSVGAVPDAPASKAPRAVASEAKPVVPGRPYLGRLDLVVEDKARFFDRISSLVSYFCQYDFIYGGVVVLPVVEVLDAAGERLRLLAALIELGLVLFIVSWGARPVLPMGVAPEATSKRLQLLVALF